MKEGGAHLMFAFEEAPLAAGGGDSDFAHESRPTVRPRPEPPRPPSRSWISHFIQNYDFSMSSLTRRVDGAFSPLHCAL